MKGDLRALRGSIHLSFSPVGAKLVGGQKSHDLFFYVKNTVYWTGLHDVFFCVKMRYDFSDHLVDSFLRSPWTSLISMYFDFSLPVLLTPVSCRFSQGAVGLPCSC